MTPGSPLDVPARLTLPTEWRVGEPVEPEVFATLSEDEILTELLAVERLQAWLAARSIAAIEQLTLHREQAAAAWFDTRHPDATGTQRQRHLAAVTHGLEDEIALATGLGTRAAHSRVAMAVREPERAAPVRDALARGDLSWSRAMHLVDKTSVAPVDTIEDIVTRCVAPYPAHSEHGVDGLLVPQAVFTSRLNRRVAAVTTPDKRHENALFNRSTSAVIDPDTGTGAFTVTGHASRIAGAHERVDDIARRLRRDGDERSLQQLRSDIALDLILHGQLPHPEASENLAAYAAFGGHLPPALVHVSVSLSSLLGASDEPGTLDAAGRQEWLSAQVIRDAAFAAGSTWKRIVTDPATGYLGDLSTQGYAVTGHLRDRILARDRISRAPGSVTPARHCDTDHDIDHALGGPSSQSNVSAKHRRGHNHKTRHTWRSERQPGINGTITWTTPTGRSYVTTPWDYRDPDPPSPEHLTTNLDRQAAAARARDIRIDPVSVWDLARRIGVDHETAFYDIAYGTENELALEERVAETARADRADQYDTPDCRVLTPTAPKSAPAPAPPVPPGEPPF